MSLSFGLVWLGLCESDSVLPLHARMTGRERAPLGPQAWPKYRRYSIIYFGLYAVLQTVVSVKTGRRIWVFVGFIWDGMLPIAYWCVQPVSGAANPAA